MILEDTDWFELDTHKCEKGHKKPNFIVYSHIIERSYMDNTCKEDVLMIYDTVTHTRIYLEERFKNGDVVLDKWLREYGIKDSIMVLGYDREQFEKKYFCVVL